MQDAGPVRFPVAETGESSALEARQADMELDYEIVD